MNELQDPNGRLKRAAASEPIPPFLEARIRARIRANARRRWAFRLAPIGAFAALCVCAGVAYQLGHLRFTVSSQESYISSVSTQVATLMRVGLGDHLHCAVFRKFPAHPPGTDEFVASMGPRFAGLIPIVRREVPAEYRLVMAHQCRYHERRFVHLALHNNSNLMSVILTRKSPGESFEIEGILPALVQSGIPIYHSSVQRFHIQAFESHDFLIYFISDLPDKQSSEIMNALAPPVRSFLEQAEI